MSFLVFKLKDTRPVDAQADYDQARGLFLHGLLEKSQDKSEQGYRRFQVYNPGWASKFQLLEAETMVWRGMNDEALPLLVAYRAAPADADGAIRELAIEGVVLSRQQHSTLANARLAQAEHTCQNQTLPACGEVIRSRGVLAMERGEYPSAEKAFVESLHYATANGDRWLQAVALLNLGAVALRQERYDEAVDWSRSANRIASELGAEDLAQVALGNLGYAYLRLGDRERSLGLFLEAEKRAADIGDIRAELNWLSTAGDSYLDSGDIIRAAQSYNQALDSATRLNSKQDIIDLLEDLAHVSIQAGNLDKADSYVALLTPLVHTTVNRLDDMDVMLAAGRIAAVRRQDQQAKEDLQAVEGDPASQTSMRLGAEHELARLFESEGDLKNADGMYRTALTTFETARDEIKNEASKLPFLANATPIYDDYIHYLVQQGKADEALAAADQSRARTLAQGLGGASGKPFKPVTLRPAEVAHKENATLLFYWLGEKQSYLWAITPKKTALFTLPPQSQIIPVVERYRRAILGPIDPIQAGNEDGRALYNMLVAPASSLIPEGASVMILNDGELSRLNFETLLAPGDSPLKAPGAPDPPSHYWIDDVTLSSAPSLSMLMAAKPAREGDKNLLMLGDAVSPGQDYPELPKAALEMHDIAHHFGPNDQTIFARQDASPGAYLAGNPDRYSYIHFVTHGVASRADPLDSAIILSREGNSEDSFKLHAREIIQHPIDARLVTISACYGSGERSYAGEGLVGLSWAFLRAGAHNVIGALWEASDESTPMLMDKLYDGLENGAAPDDALRKAKLALLHSDGKFHSPFYWASFQITTGQ